MGSAFERLLRNPPPALVVFLAGAMLVLAALADNLAHRGIGFEVFYLIPVLLAAWFLDRTWGLGMAVLAAGIWVVLDLVDPPALWDPLITLWNGASRLLLYGAAAYVAPQLKEALTRSRALTRVDELTGAKNPSAFYEATRGEIERARRSGSPLTVAFMDVAGFDDVASSQGRGAGDRLLKVVAGAVAEVVRSTDHVARLHDDEFALMFPETGRVEAGAVLLKVTENVRDAIADNSWPTHVRVGAVTFTSAPESVNEMRRVMEEVLHDARQAGPDVVEHHVLG